MEYSELAGSYGICPAMVRQLRDSSICAMVQSGDEIDASERKQSTSVSMLKESAPRSGFLKDEYCLKLCAETAKGYAASRMDARFLAMQRESQLAEQPLAKPSEAVQNEFRHRTGKTLQSS